MKIWLLLDSKGPGGIESHVHQLASGLKSHHQDVEVVLLTNYGPHPLRRTLQNLGITVRTLDGSMTTLWQALGKHQPDVVHTHGYKSGIFGRLAARMRGIACISTFHAGETPRGRLQLYDWIDRQSSRLASKVFAVSPNIAKRLPVASQLSDNFINTDKIKPSKGDRIAFVGRLSYEKGPDRFIALAAQHPQRVFHVYGDGPMADELRRNASDNVQFHGLQSSMDTHWSEIGILVMPSRNEGLPMAAIEAMARGIPVLASDVGALDALISHKVNGWLVPSGDQAALSFSLREWVNQNPIKRRAMQLTASDQVAKRFSSNAVIPRMISMYWQTA